MTSANDMIQTEMLQTIYNLIHAYDRNDGQKLYGQHGPLGETHSDFLLRG